MKFYSAIIAVAVLFSGGCSTNPGSDIPEQLNDGGWVMNIPNAPHTHRVTLRACPDQPITTTHVHDHNQVGRGPHKHNGCFVCPTKPSLASRLYDK